MSSRQRCGWEKANELSWTVQICGSWTVGLRHDQHRATSQPFKRRGQVHLQSQVLEEPVSGGIARDLSTNGGARTEAIGTRRYGARGKKNYPSALQ
jgi:hypothetical protein